MRGTARPQDRKTHRSLERGLGMLEAVAINGGAASLADMVRRTGLHRSTAFHLLQRLVDLDYLRQDATTRCYELSAKLFQLTGRTWSSEQLGQVAQPFLAELTRRAGESSSLAAWRDGSVTVAAKCESDGPVRVVQNLGALRPLHATAVAKAILPWLPHGELAGVLRGVQFQRYTPKTIMTRAALETELRRIRAAGYAIDDEEHIEGIRCIAAPVFGPAGQVVASLCALGPRSRMSHRRLRQLKTPLLEQARAMSERLGWHSG
jgi:DNA-binding IclR family transcriptional regulator